MTGPPVRPSKGQSGVLQVIDYSVARSMTAQPPGFSFSALRVTTHGQQVASLGRSLTPLQRCSRRILQPQPTGRTANASLSHLCSFLFFRLLDVIAFQHTFSLCTFLCYHTLNINFYGCMSKPTSSPSKKESIAERYNFKFIVCRRNYFGRWGFDFILSSNKNQLCHSARVTFLGNIKGCVTFSRPLFLIHSSSRTDQIWIGERIQFLNHCFL